MVNKKWGGSHCFQHLEAHEIHPNPWRFRQVLAVPAASFETSPAPLRCRASPNRWHLQSHPAPRSWGRCWAAGGWKLWQLWESWPMICCICTKIGLKDAMSNDMIWWYMMIWMESNYGRNCDWHLDGCSKLNKINGMPSRTLFCWLGHRRCRGLDQ